MKAISLLLFVLLFGTSDALSFDPSSANENNGVTDLTLVNRFYAPYGPGTQANGETYTGTGFGILPVSPLLRTIQSKYMSTRYPSWDI